MQIIYIENKLVTAVQSADMAGSVTQLIKSENE